MLQVQCCWVLFKDVKSVHELILNSYLDEFVWRERHGRSAVTCQPLQCVILHTMIFCTVRVQCSAHTCWRWVFPTFAVTDHLHSHLCRNRPVLSASRPPLIYHCTYITSCVDVLYLGMHLTAHCLRRAWQYTIKSNCTLCRTRGGTYHMRACAAVREHVPHYSADHVYHYYTLSSLKKPNSLLFV